MSEQPDRWERGDPWDDEWSAEDWHDLDVMSRRHRNESSWVEWAAKLVVTAIAVPIVLGALAYFLIVVL